MFAHAIPEVTPARAGFHVLWMGPRSWVYSPGGWLIQRRRFERRHEELDCLNLTQGQLGYLHARRELSTRFGALSLRQGSWLRPLTSFTMPRIAQPPTACDVLTLELDQVRSYVSVRATATGLFTVALRAGKAVAGGTVSSGVATHELSAGEIDTIVVYAFGLTTLRYCVRVDAPWTGVPIVKHLQLPIRELMPSLSDADAEYAEAKSRLFLGETLDPAEFKSLADLLRTIVRRAGPPRPLDLTLLLRNDLSADFEELSALDPIRILLPHPRWRRVLGFAWFDGDPTLVPGERYEYRVTAAFPPADLFDRVYGFHSMPAEIALPAEFYLAGMRVRLPQPTHVELAPGSREGLRVVARRAIRVEPKTEQFWRVPLLDEWSAVIDFPDPVRSVILEVAPGHSLTYAFGAAWNPPSGAAPIPAGTAPRLDFPVAIHELRVGGSGFLHAIRIPAAAVSPGPLVPQFSLISPTALVEAPLPDPPISVDLENLQQPDLIPANDRPPGPTPPRHALGFQVRWRPAPLPGIVAWPPDLDAAPPLDATLFQIEHRQTTPTLTPWVPVLEEENYTVGDREYHPSLPEIHTGADLLAVFPEVRGHGPGSFDLVWRDVFDFADNGSDSLDVRRPVPPPGTEHQYRIRAVDAIGRPSAKWRESGAKRLEKRVPPPLPAAPDLTPADRLTLPEPSGVQARVLVKGAPDLTDEDRSTLGSHVNAIVMRWGWHAEQRSLDQWATEFRVYAMRRRLGSVEGTLGAVTALDGEHFEATITFERAVSGNVGKGAILTAGAQFRIVEHTAGPTISAILRAMERRSDGTPIAPVSGSVTFPARVTPDQTRAPAWGPRLALQTIDDRTVYEVVLYDLLDLRPDHARDAIYLGVSAADAQSYVSDPLSPIDSRAGNESAIAPVYCEARWYGRPTITEAPALVPVPIVVTPEPSDRALAFRLDLGLFLAPGILPAGARVRPERVADDGVFRAYRVDSDRVIARVIEPAAPGDAEVEVTIPNPADRTAIMAALGGADVDALEDRYVVFLAASHPYRARLFTPATRAPISLGAFNETLPNRSARWVYRLRLADQADHLSADGITLRCIVRVPTSSRVAAPEREARLAGDPASLLRVRVSGGFSVTQLLVFTYALASNERSAARAELLRIASSGRVPPDGVRLRLGDLLIAPSVKALGDPDVLAEGAYRRVEIDLGAAPGTRLRVWGCAATRDGVLSPVAGPWRVHAPPPPLIAPDLSLTGIAPNLVFNWTWPPMAEKHMVRLEHAAEGAPFECLSPPLSVYRTSLAVIQPPGAWRYRLRVRALDGRETLSNEVIP
jgi:hypothetical protein